jgi:hypothetical protein
MAVLLLERDGCGLKIACLSRVRLPRLPISLTAPGARATAMINNVLVLLKSPRHQRMNF